MTIRKTWRLFCLAVASFFWASCSNDSSTQPSESESPDSNSSADVGGDEESSDSSESVSSSSTAATENSSSDATGESSSSPVEYVLANDPSVTCEETTEQVYICGSTKGLTCDDYQRYLAKDTTLSQKILMGWEEALETCGAIQENVALYGIVYNPCMRPYADVPAMKCSDGNTYTNFKLDGNQVSISSSSSAASESSSSVAEDAVKNCPQEDFALFADVLADVQKELYVKVDNLINMNLTLSDTQKEYLEGMLDRDNQTMKGNLSPYLPGEDFDVMYQGLNYESKNWFNGYIAKTKTCADGTPETTEKYQQKYNAILTECMDLIEASVKAMD